GRIEELSPELCELLTEPGAIAIDESDKNRLGIKQVGDVAEINGHNVRVVGMTHGLKSLAGPYVFCSRTTARLRLRLQPTQTTYVLAKCHNPAEAPAVVARMRKQYDNLSSFTAEEFSFRSRLHWLLKTKAGIALGYAAALG